MSFWFNPAIVFATTWFLTISVYLANNSEFVVKSSSSALLYLIGLLVVVIGFGFPTRLKELVLYLDNFRINRINVRIIGLTLLPILIIEVISEIRYFGTLPFMASLALSDDVDYNMVGSVFKFRHNIFVKANSIFLGGYYYLLYRLTYLRKYLFVVLIVVCITLLYISRSTLMSITCILSLIYFLTAKITLKRFSWIILLAVILSYGFDKMYFLRNMGSSSFMENEYENLGFYDSVFRGFNTIANYISSPVSNFLYNIDRGTFSSLEWHPTYLVRPFFPRVIGDLLFGNIDFNTSLEFPNRSNTFTSFPHMLFALGTLGSPVFFLTILGFCLKWIYVLFKLNPTRWLLLVVFVNHMLILTVFSSSLFNIVYHFPIVLSWLFPPVSYSKNR